MELGKQCTSNSDCASGNCQDGYCRSKQCTSCPPKYYCATADDDLKQSYCLPLPLVPDGVMIAIIIIIICFVLIVAVLMYEHFKNLRKKD